MIAYMSMSWFGDVLLFVDVCCVLELLGPLASSFGFFSWTNSSVTARLSQVCKDKIGLRGCKACLPSPPFDHLSPFAIGLLHKVLY